MAGGILGVVSNSELDAREQAELEANAEAEANQKFPDKAALDHLAGFIRHKFHHFRKIRETRGISVRLLESLRAFRGQYSDTKLQEIQQFGGSEVYARVTAVKCRGATAMLRDIYMGAERPWFLQPTPDPEIPGDIQASVLQLVQTETQHNAAAGVETDPQQIQDRISQLRKSAKQAALKQSKQEAKSHTRNMDDVLVEGRFYEALDEFLLDITVFPYAIMKGPFVEKRKEMNWNGEALEVEVKNKLRWKRVNPFDMFWATGQVNFEDADVIEKIRMSPAELSGMLGLPGYNDDNIRQALEAYGNGGLSDWLDYTDTEEARLEEREDPHHNESDMIDTLYWQGKIQGKLLREWEMPNLSKDKIKDEEFYHVNAWIVGDYIIKVFRTPNPKERHNYYMSSFEKIPGAIVGHGIPELIGDIQSVMNATLRALVNNLSIASGPQVTVNLDRIAEGTDPNQLFPWKRWMVEDDPLGTSKEPPVSFWQPNSNAQELLFVYQSMANLADEISTVPKYMTGNEKVGGAGRTASGLSMLMGASAKVVQSVATNIDNDVMRPALEDLHMMLLLNPETRGEYRGDENVMVRGVSFSIQKETERMRSLEFLQMTANPIDMGIIGPDGRAEVLRQVTDALGMDHATIVPDEETMRANQQAAMMGQQGAGAPAPGGVPPEQQQGPGSQPQQQAQPIRGIAGNG